MLRRSVLLLLVGCVIHSSAEAFPVGFLDGFTSIVEGTGTHVDLFGVLFIPCVVTLVLTKRALAQGDNWRSVVPGLDQLSRIYFTSYRRDGNAGYGDSISALA